MLLDDINTVDWASNALITALSAAVLVFLERRTWSQKNIGSIWIDSISLATAIALCWGWKTKTYEDMMYEVEGEFFLELCAMYSYAYFTLLLPLTGMAYQKKSSVSKNIVWPASSSSYHDIMGAKCYLLSNCTPLKLGADSSNQILLLCRPTPNLGFPDFSWSFLVTASIMGLHVRRLDTIHYINGREN